MTKVPTLWILGMNISQPEVIKHYLFGALCIGFLLLMVKDSRSVVSVFSNRLGPSAQK